MKKIKIIENIVLTIIKFYIILCAMMAAGLNDYIIPLTEQEKFLYRAGGLLIAILIDLIVNFIIYKILSKNNKIKFINFFIPSFCITIIIYIILYLYC